MSLNNMAKYFVKQTLCVLFCHCATHTHTGFLSYILKKHKKNKIQKHKKKTLTFPDKRYDIDHVPIKQRRT